MIAWVKVPTVSHTANTTIYLCYDNTSITTDQSNKTGVWDSNYKVVNHFANGTTLSAVDSTGNGNNGTLNNAPTATIGQIDGGVALGNPPGLFTAATQSVSNASPNAIPAAGGPLTLELWISTVAGTKQTIYLSRRG